MGDRNLSSEEAHMINNLMPGFQVLQAGTLLKNALDALGATGKAIYLDPTNGDDNNDGLSAAKAVKTLPVGYGLLRDGYNDVLYYIPGSSSISLSAKLTWAKSYAHFIGLCAPVSVGQRSRIFQAAAATGVSPLIDVTGNANIFKNLYIFHGVNDATSKICVQVTGQRNYFENVHFAGIGHATMDVAGACSLKINAGAENKFVGCNFGVDTIASGANGTEIWFDGAATRNEFVDCMINRYISNASHALVTIEDAQGIDRWLKFKNCIFMTDSENQAVSMTSVFNIKAGIVQGKIVLFNCMMMTDGSSGTGDWDSNNRGILFNSAVAPAASAAGGVATKQ